MRSIQLAAGSRARCLGQKGGSRKPVLPLMEKLDRNYTSIKYSLSSEYKRTSI